MFADGLIDNTNMKVSFNGIKAFITDRLQHRPLVYYPKNPTSPWLSCIQGFQNKYGGEIQGNASFKMHRQQSLSYDHGNSQEAMQKYLNMVVDSGGEGLMLRRPDKPYECCRSHFLLKVKPFDDAEGTVIGYTTGRATDKGSRLLGKMGAMILQLGPQFGSNTMELSGFTDEERILCERDGIKSELYASDWAIKNPGVEVPDRIEAKMFPRGSIVSFRYRGTNDSGIPNEARFWRKDERI